MFSDKKNQRANRLVTDKIQKHYGSIIPTDEEVHACVILHADSLSIDDFIMTNVSKLSSEIDINHVIIHRYIFKQLILQNRRWISYVTNNTMNVFAHYSLLSNQQD